MIEQLPEEAIKKRHQEPQTQCLPETKPPGKYGHRERHKKHVLNQYSCGEEVNTEPSQVKEPHPECSVNVEQSLIPFPQLDLTVIQVEP